MATSERVGLVLGCRGMGDCLFGQAVIKKLRRVAPQRFDLFTHNPGLFHACPYVENV